ncbi:hypothetical protein Bca4012_030201 [Brassica carinata]|uniref:(rape) hypothetical protein n=1 Tax=Brassica napus TaxID=3708 RepID=A0A816JL06_BRANA|nr:unnamed protein product [Brassica napus]
MADHCMVIPGEWTSAGSLWEFVIDKKKMSRIVPVRAGMSLSELQSNVVQEFYTFTDPAPQSVLSYWPPNMKELATGFTTPPVILTNDGAVSFFFYHLAVYKTMNLFDTFHSEVVKPQDTQVDENAYITPNQTFKPHFNHFRPSSSSSSKISSFSLFDEEELLQDAPLNPNSVNTTPHPIPPAEPHRVSVQDETLLCGEEMLEKMFKEDPDHIPDTWLLEEEDTTEPESSQPPNPIPERGYDQDQDFWEPLIKESLGGSHSTEVMAGIQVPKTASETYQSYVGNAFDHTVRVSGEDDTDWKKDLDFMGVHQRDGPPVQS